MKKFFTKINLFICIDSKIKIFMDKIFNKIKKVCTFKTLGDF